jgi:hypothetical protein
VCVSNAPATRRRRPLAPALGGSAAAQDRYGNDHQQASEGDHMLSRRAGYMYVIRNTFIAKPGQAGKLAAQVKAMGSVGLRNCRVLTDMTGDFNDVVMEYEVESLAEFDDLLKRYTSDPQVRECANPLT